MKRVIAIHLRIGAALLAASCLFGLSANAQQGFSEASASAQADVRKATDDLAALRERIAAEKIPLATELADAERTLLDRKRELQRLGDAQQQGDDPVTALRAEMKLRQDELTFTGNLLGEYVRAFETRLHAAEVQRYQDRVHAALNAPENGNLAPSEKLSLQLDVVKLALERLEHSIGGEAFDGDALVAENIVKPGRFALAGPIAVFASKDGQHAGPAQLQLNALLPTVVDLDGDLAAGVKNVVTNGKGSLPVDASLGNAIRIQETRESLVAHIRAGGPVMAPIIALAFIAALVACFKFFEISRVKSPAPGVVQTILDHVHHHNDAQAIALAASVGGPFGDLLTAGVQHARESKTVLEEVLYERMLAAQPKLERLLAVIALTAGAAPLLGLLGTVTGMIQTFKLITLFGSGDVKPLSSGIAEALITTEYGLYVAIPALLAHALLARLARGKLGELEQTAVAFVNGLGPEVRE